MSRSSSIRLYILLSALMYLTVQSLGMHFHRSEATHGGHSHTHVHGHDHDAGAHVFSFELPQPRGHDSEPSHAALDIDSAATADVSVSQFKSPLIPLFLFAYE